MFVEHDQFAQFKIGVNFFPPLYHLLLFRLPHAVLHGIKTGLNVAPYGVLAPLVGGKKSTDRAVFIDLFHSDIVERARKMFAAIVLSYCHHVYVPGITFGVMNGGNGPDIFVAVFDKMHVLFRYAIFVMHKAIIKGVVDLFIGAVSPVPKAEKLLFLIIIEIIIIAIIIIELLI